MTSDLEDEVLGGLETYSSISKLIKKSGNYEDDINKVLKKRSFDTMLNAVDSLNAKKSTTEQPQKKRKIEKQNTHDYMISSEDESNEDQMNVDNDESSNDDSVFSEISDDVSSGTDDENQDETQSASKNGKNRNFKRSNEPEVDDGKRKISKSMEKNRGTKNSKKNSLRGRAKHKEKYAKALKKRASHITRMRDKTQPYQGEKSGIRTHVVHSVSLNRNEKVRNIRLY